MTENGLQVIDRRMKEEPETAVSLQDNSPAGMMIAAMSKGMDLDKLEKFMGLQERWEANEAKKAYVKAMAAFKANPPEILKTAHVSYVNSKNQTVEWDHAVLGEIAEAITSAMSPYGFYHRWDMKQPDAKTVQTTCIITHEMGHSEEITMSGPPDTSGAKDELKAVSSTNTFLQRLTLLALTGLAAKGMDREEPPEEIQYIDEKQLSRIKDYIDNYGVSEAMFLKVMDAESLEKIPLNQFNKAIASLEAKRVQVEKKRKEAKS